MNKMQNNDKEVISNLKFIGMIEKHKKLNLSTFDMLPEGLLTKLLRTFVYSDSKEGALEFVETTIDRAFDIITKFKDSERISDIYLIKNIVSDIIRSINGINNLAITYEHNVKFKGDLELVKQTIVPRLKELKRIKPSLFEDESKISFFIDESLRCDSRKRNDDTDIFIPTLGSPSQYLFDFMQGKVEDSKEKLKLDTTYVDTEHKSSNPNPRAGESTPVDIPNSKGKKKRNKSDSSKKSDFSI